MQKISATFFASWPKNILSADAFRTLWFSDDMVSAGAKPAGHALKKRGRDFLPGSADVVSARLVRLCCCLLRFPPGRRAGPWVRVRGFRLASWFVRSWFSLFYCCFHGIPPPHSSRCGAGRGDSQVRRWDLRRCRCRSCRCRPCSRAWYPDW